jgi:RNA polymerase sigma-70 factor (ECF subfamily)
VDDEGVTRALRERDEDAFRSLVDAWAPLMKRVARGYVSTDASAEEIVQDTWLGVLRGIDAFEGRSSLRTWTFRILTNLAKSRGVRERRTLPIDPQRLTEDAWPSSEDSVLAADTTASVTITIASLPERQRLVITLRDVHGYSSDEVCELLDLTAGNQRVLLHRARAAVRATLSPAA